MPIKHIKVDTGLQILPAPLSFYLLQGPSGRYTSPCILYFSSPGAGLSFPIQSSNFGYVSLLAQAAPLGWKFLSPLSLSLLPSSYDLVQFGYVHSELLRMCLHLAMLFHLATINRLLHHTQERHFLFFLFLFPIHLVLKPGTHHCCK